MKKFLKANYKKDVKNACDSYLLLNDNKFT
jgi:hypothetical protein